VPRPADFGAQGLGGASHRFLSRERSCRAKTVLSALKAAAAPARTMNFRETKTGSEDEVTAPPLFLAERASALMMRDIMRILVVEDDDKIASFVVKGLKESGYAVDHCRDGEEALAMGTSVRYDAAVVDIMIPNLDGLSLVRRWRDQRIGIPVIFLSARAAVDDRVAGLQAGGDDYLTKPFSFTELSARLHALIRRSTQTAEPTRLAAGDLTMDLVRREVRRGDTLVELQPREFALLEYLMRHANRTVTKTMILESIFDYSFDPQTNVVDVLIHRLRGKVDPERQRIHTIRGVGYVLRPV